MKSQVFVPASIGNVGPGFDALGLAVEGIGNTLSTELLDGGRDVIEKITGIDQDLVPSEPLQNATTVAARKFLELKGKGHLRLRLVIGQGVPVSGGLGSSAVAAVAGAYGAAVALGEPYTNDDLYVSALAGEVHASSKHLDNIAPSILGGLTLALSTVPPKALSLRKDFSWRVALITPEVQIDTKDSRQVLPKSLPQENWVKVMAHAAGVASSFVAHDDKMLKETFLDPFAEKYRGELIPNFDEMKQKAEEAGALACSISGSGPTIFAICADDKRADECLSSMSSVLSKPPRLQKVCKIASQGARVVS